MSTHYISGMLPIAFTYIMMFNLYYILRDWYHYFYKIKEELRGKRFAEVLTASEGQLSSFLLF